ncbi:MAG TPA: MBL fold metallo-hydrolase [Burkholderiales bacterium]|nr:MBL fold metallo-hydrolase [Burkholderiales bacterium]
MATGVAGRLIEADSIEVLVLVDNVTDSLSSVPRDVRNETAVLRKAGSLPVSAGEYRCCAHHGLSLVITVKSGREKQTLLFDAGPEAYAVSRNGALLKAPFGDASAVVLSHGHWDHAGGLVEAIRLIAANNEGRNIECHVNPGMFAERGMLRPGSECLLQKPVPIPPELIEAGAFVVNDAEPRLVCDGLFYLSGEIPRVTRYERGLPGHVRRASDGMSWEPDPLIMDERYLAVHVKKKGIVVFTACSHAGVVNVLSDARNVFDGVPLHAVMGGFHLSGEDVEAIIPETVKDMQAFRLKRIVPAHCTGWRAVHALVNAFGADVIVPSAVGRQFMF